MSVMQLTKSYYGMDGVAGTIDRALAGSTVALIHVF